MSLPIKTPTTGPGHQDTTPTVDNMPPTRSKVIGGLAALACAACCAIPLLIAVGVLTGAGAAILEQTLLAVAAGLVVVAVGMWWLHRHRNAQRAATAGGANCGCGGRGCGC
jgi:high-affinity Fe2+/Pb2+ permease